MTSQRLSLRAGAGLLSVAVALLPSCKPAPGTPGAPDYAAQPFPRLLGRRERDRASTRRRSDGFVNPGKRHRLHGSHGEHPGDDHHHGRPTARRAGARLHQVPRRSRRVRQAVQGRTRAGWRSGGLLADALVAVTGYAGGFIPERKRREEDQLRELLVQHPDRRHDDGTEARGDELHGDAHRPGSWRRRRSLRSCWRRRTPRRSTRRPAEARLLHGHRQDGAPVPARRSLRDAHAPPYGDDARRPLPHRRDPRWGRPP